MRLQTNNIVSTYAGSWNWGEEYMDLSRTSLEDGWPALTQGFIVPLIPYSYLIEIKYRSER